MIEELVQFVVAVLVIGRHIVVVATANVNIRVRVAAAAPIPLVSAWLVRRRRLCVSD